MKADIALDDRLAVFFRMATRVVEAKGVPILRGNRYSGHAFWIAAEKRAKTNGNGLEDGAE